MRKSWWYLSLVFGLVVSAALIWRVAAQRHHIERTKIDNRIKAIDEKLSLGQYNPENPLSYTYYDLAADLQTRLENKTFVTKNEQPLRYVAAWARFMASKSALEEAFGDENAPGDPRPRTYQDAWQELLASISAQHPGHGDLEGDIDVPLNRGDESDFAYFINFVGDRLLKSESDPKEFFGIQTNAQDTITSADEEALAMAGVTLLPEGSQSDKNADLILGDTYGVYEAFLSNRLALLEQADEMNFAIAHRFVELELPEYAWQHYNVMFEDVSIGKGITLTNMLKRVLDAKRRYVFSLADYADQIGSPNSQRDLTAKVRFDRANDHYNTVLAKYESELMTAATSARQALGDREGLRDKKQRYQRLRETIEAQQKELGEFDEAVFKATYAGTVDDEQELLRQTNEARRDVEREKTSLQFQLDHEINQIADALDAIEKFQKHLGKTTENIGADEFIPLDVLTNLIANNKKLGDIVTKPRPHLNGADVIDGKDALDRYVEALRSVLLIDLKVLRARVTRIVSPEASQSGEVNSSLTGVEDALDLIREAYGYKLRTPLKRRDYDSFLNSSHFLMVDQLIRDYERESLAALESSLDDRDFFSTLTHSLRTLKSSLLEASLELAELKHAEAVEQLARLSSPDRPYVTAGAANKYMQDYLDWYDRARAAFAQGKALPPKAYRNKEVHAAVRAYEEMEITYRKLRDDAMRAYQSFDVVEDEEIKRIAQFGTVSLRLDDWLYRYEFKRKEGYATLQPGNDDTDFFYGIFGFVDGIPLGLEGAETLTEQEGYWLPRTQTAESFRRGPPKLTMDEVSNKLQRLLQLTPGQDPHLYAATRIRAGQLQELQSILPRTGGELVELRKVLYPGDFAGAIRDYYLPVLRNTSAIPNDALVRNRFIPLSDHFQRVSSKLENWLDNVDVSSPMALQALFESLSPERSSDENAMDKISDFFTEYFKLTAARQPSLLAVQDAVYDFNFHLGELAAIRARLLLDQANAGSYEMLMQAQRSEARSKDFFQAAGKILMDYVVRFPNAAGELTRQIKIGNAFFRSEDYVFAIAAYQRYFDERRLSDWRREKVELFYVANAIGEAYMKLGILEGPSMTAARMSGDEGEVERQQAVETMQIDGAIPAFYWVTERTRKLLTGLGEADLPQNRLPLGSLDAFVNLAKARIELGRTWAGTGDQRGSELLEKAANDLRRDVIEARIFDRPPIAFDQSLAWRDAQYNIGLAHLELARQARAEGEIAYAKLNEHLDKSEQAFRDITERWNSPVERGIYLRQLKQGKSYSEASIEASQGGVSADHTDDIYYLTILNAAELDWLRAVHSPDPTSSVVLSALRSARPRLEFLREKLDRIHGTERNVLDTTFTFYKLDRHVRYLLGDVRYLEARTMRDRREERDSIDSAEIRDAYYGAISAYKDAMKQYPDTYLAAWAYGQIMNAYRGLIPFTPEAEAEEQRMLEKADTFLESLSAEAFDDVPQAFARGEVSNFYDWYQTLRN